MKVTLAYLHIGNYQNECRTQCLEEIYRVASLRYAEIKHPDWLEIVM